MLSNELQIYINSSKQPSISTILTKKTIPVQENKFLATCSSPLISLIALSLAESAYATELRLSGAKES